MNHGELAALHFGRDDAELDMADGGLLRNGFLRTPSYAAVLSGRKHLVIGRKGSGKSAICVTLAELDDGGQTAMPVTPDDISAQAVRDFELGGVGRGSSKEMIWRYVLAVQTAKYVSAHWRRAHHGRAPEPVDRLRRFLRDNGEIDDYRSYGKLWQITQKLKSSLTLEAFGVKVTMDVHGADPGPRADRELDVLERHVREALEQPGCAHGHGGLLILVDQIEKLWENDVDSSALVTGLLLAAKRATSTLRGVRCVIFLRSDIYDVLHFSERDKFRGGEIRITWSPKELAELLRARAGASLGRDVSPDELWGGVFPRHVAGRPAAEFLADHTLMRPRDIIQLANLCRDTAEQNGHQAIHGDDVTEALPQYSRWKLQDLVAEYFVNYPFLERLLPLFEDAGYLVLRSMLRRRLESVLPSIARHYPEFAQTLTADSLIEILYGIGFLGVARNHEPVYVYDRDARIGVHDDDLYIHPCFRAALRALTPTDIHPYRLTVRVHRSARTAQVSQIAGGQVMGLLPDRSHVIWQTLHTALTHVGDTLTAAHLPPPLVADIRRALDAIQHELQRAAMGADDDPVYALHVAGGARESLVALRSELARCGLSDDQRVATLEHALDVEIERIHDATAPHRS